MRETAVVVGSLSLVGVLSEPDEGAACRSTAMIFVNAGSTHRSGPNRLYVRLARYLADKGYRCLRFDLPGIGDSPPARGLGKFRDYAADQVRAAMDDLQEMRGCRGFVLFGLCGGADIAFDAGAADERVQTLILANGAFVDGDDFAHLYHEAERWTTRRFYRFRVLSLRRWWRLITFQSKFWTRLRRRRREKIHATRLACGQFTREMETSQTHQKWADLARRNVDILLTYSEGSVFWDMYTMVHREALSGVYSVGRLDVAFYKNVDHTFTLLSSQQRLASHIAIWLEHRQSTATPCELPTEVQERVIST